MLITALVRFFLTVAAGSGPYHNDFDLRQSIAVYPQYMLEIITVMGENGRFHKPPHGFDNKPA